MRHTEPMMPRVAATLTLLLLALSTATCAPLAAVNLGAAEDFTVLAATGITNSGPTAIQGQIGVSPVATTAITGSAQILFSDVLAGLGDFGIALEPVDAKAALGTAYNAAKDLTDNDMTLMEASSMVGVTFTAGLYKRNGALALESGEMYISGSSTDVFIFQIAETLTVNSGAKMIMVGDAQAKNVFWQVGTTAAFLAGSHVEGTVMAGATIALVAGATVTGRLFSVEGAVTLLTNTIVYPE